MKPEVTYSIEIQPETIPIKGSFAYGSEQEDKDAEDAIAASVRAGNDWAWCQVTVMAEFETDSEVYRGYDYLGGCSYVSEADFKQGGYYEDMKSQALADLKNTLRVAVERGETAKDVLAALE